jgi:DNA repair protein RecN (Recombination protein N)
MLSTLHIHNFAIVSKLLLDCPAKMSAFTGETGAGKSIMIDALAILLGNRTDASIVRPGNEKCEISAQFFYDLNSEIHSFLQEHELLSEPGEILIRRIVNKEGRSKFFINDHVSSAQQVKLLGQMLVHIHGQHEQQNLLSHQTHREHLDTFAQLHELKANIKQAYFNYQTLLDELKTLEQQQVAQEQLQLWEYQLNELAELAPQELELEKLYQEHHELHHAHQYLQHIADIEQLLDNDENTAISSQLHHIQQILSHLPQEHPNIKNVRHLIESAIIQIDESQDELKQFANQVTIDPERLCFVEERMRKWHQLARKLQIDVHELPAQQEILKTQINKIKNSDLEKSTLQINLNKQHQAYLELAYTLREKRREHAKELALSIEEIIHELGMPHAKLSIDIQALDDMHPHGMDRIEYLIATNPGSEKASLAKVASGGELSRISLSIHLITAQRGTTPTLLFDEVDVGIGGATAMKVGQRLRELGEKLQIFCVTHQPQVASCAHQHFQVSKYTEKSQTFSSIIELNEEERINEIARMLGGLAITEQTKNNARELLDLAQV